MVSHHDRQKPDTAGRGDTGAYLNQLVRVIMMREAKHSMETEQGGESHHDRGKLDTA